MTKQAKPSARRWEDPAIRRQQITQPIIEAAPETTQPTSKQRKGGKCVNCAKPFKIEKQQAKKKKFCCDSCRYEFARNNSTAYGQLKSKLGKFIEQRAKAHSAELMKLISELSRDVETLKTQLSKLTA